MYELTVWNFGTFSALPNQFQFCQVTCQGCRKLLQSMNAKCTRIPSVGEYLVLHFQVNKTSKQWNEANNVKFCGHNSLLSASFQNEIGLGMEETLMSRMWSAMVRLVMVNADHMIPLLDPKKIQNLPGQHQTLGQFATWFQAHHLACPLVGKMVTSATSRWNNHSSTDCPCDASQKHMGITVMALSHQDLNFYLRFCGPLHWWKWLFFWCISSLQTCSLDRHGRPHHSWGKSGHSLDYQEISDPFP